MSNLFAKPWFTALAVPVVFLFLAAGANKLVRGRGWEQDDFFLGVKATLAAMSSALIYLFELGRSIIVATSDPASTAAANNLTNRLMGALVFMLVCFFMFVVVLSIHQDWETRTYIQEDKLPRTARLLIFANFIGFSLLFLFVFVVKGAQ